MRSDPRGAYYTPPGIVSLIVENTIGRFLHELPPHRASEITILDPACGTGAFLTGAYSYLLDGLRVEDADVRKRLLLNSIYGADLDEVALSEARMNLQSPSANANLIHGDSLMNIDWTRHFPKAMSRGGFDAVIGNPPWVSLAGRFGIRAYSEAQIESLRRRFGGNSYMPNVFEYFISLGLELTRPGGYFAFIVPDRLAFNRQFAYLRKRLLAETELLLLVHGIPFPGVIADTMVFVCRKGAPKPDAVTESRGYDGSSSIYPQSEMLRSPGCEFRRPLDQRVSRIVEWMESLGGPLLMDICQITSGFGGRSSLVTEHKVSGSQIPVLKGDSIERYAVRKVYWFDFRVENLTGRTRDPAKLGASPKVLIRKTGNGLIAAYDDSGKFPEQSLYFLFNTRRDIFSDSSGLDLKFVLGILNSRLMGIYYRARCLTNPRTIAHAKTADLARIPMPSPEPEQHNRLVALVDEALKGRTEAIEDRIDELVCRLYGVDMEDLPPKTG